MDTYRKKPVVIEAAQMNGQTAKIAEWLIEGGCGFSSETHPTDSTKDRLFINTLEGTMTAEPGDWIVKGVQGEFYPVKPDIFVATYEKVTPPHNPGGVMIGG